MQRCDKKREEVLIWDDKIILYNLSKNTEKNGHFDGVEERNHTFCIKKLYEFCSLHLAISVYYLLN